jgi:peptidoglycan/xylan/chitin deacetylase (PgdA/CDA1 family)
METSLVLKIIFLCVFLYALAPTLLIRLGRVGAVARAARGYGRVALTFDDGPDPKYTPQILDILNRYQVKACFFVVGSKVRAYPGLTRQILQAGHAIGNHGFRHKAIWLLSPRATRREIAESNLAIEELTGQKTMFCRPAWGLFNLFSIWYCRVNGQKVVLWTYMSWDWTRKATPESICRKVLGRLKDGAIIILHDSDSAFGAAKGSPAQMVEALPRILEGIEEKGLRVAPLDEILNYKKKLTLRHVFRRLWSFVDMLARRLSGITDMPNSKIWRIAVRRSGVRTGPCPTGTVLKPANMI